MITLARAIERLRKKRILTGITDGERSEIAEAYDLALEIMRKEQRKQERKEDVK